MSCLFLFYADLSNVTFRFDEQGSGPARYTVFNYQKVENYTYAWVPVGNYFSKSSMPICLRLSYYYIYLSSI